jgi:MerR family mercuric resistance operon transcriptional regulator
MESLTIGRLAKLVEMDVETIRYYQREGLVVAPPRPAGGYRHYPSETVERLRFIKRAKVLGFSLKEVRELLALRIDPGTTCDQVKSRAEMKIADIEERIVSLKRMRRALRRLAAACSGDGAVDECPIIAGLEDKDR